MSAPVTVDLSVRRRLLAVLFGGVGITRTGFIAAVTVTALAAEDLLGAKTWAGLPGAVAVIAMAIATGPMSDFMGRRGRRPGLVLGLSVSALGAGLAVAALVAESFLFLVLAAAVMGAGNSADRLARYAAADVAPDEWRGSAIALIVWAGTIGSVLGPLLLSPAQELGEAIGLPGLGGPYVLAAVGFVLAAGLAAAGLRPDPLSFHPEERLDTTAPAVSWRRLVETPTVRLAILALGIGQFVMVLLMAMTPIHIRDGGETLGQVGLVIGAHTFGMFALSPLTGWFSDRIGRIPLVVAGHVTLGGAALLAAGAAGDDIPRLVVSLFLLGLGWNFSFIAGSALLVDDIPAEWRLRAQGLGDTVAWSSGAAASLVSGVILGLGGYGLVSLVGAALTLIPLAAVTRARMAAAVG